MLKQRTKTTTKKKMGELLCFGASSPSPPLFWTRCAAGQAKVHGAQPCAESWMDHCVCSQAISMVCSSGRGLNVSHVFVPTTESTFFPCTSMAPMDYTVYIIHSFTHCNNVEFARNKRLCWPAEANDRHDRRRRRSRTLPTWRPQRPSGTHYLPGGRTGGHGHIRSAEQRRHRASSSTCTTLTCLPPCLNAVQSRPHRYHPRHRRLPHPRPRR